MNHDCHTFSCSSRLSHWHTLQCRWLEDCWKHRHLKSVQKPATSSLQAFPNKIQNAKSLDPFQVTAHTPPPVLYMYIGAWRFPDLRKLLSGMSPKFQVISHWSLQSQLWTPFLRRSWFWWWGVPVEYLNNFGWKLVWLLKSSKVVVVGSHKKSNLSKREVSDMLLRKKWINFALDNFAAILVRLNLQGGRPKCLRALLEERILPNLKEITTITNKTLVT